VKSEVFERNGRKRIAGALSGVLGAGFMLGAGGVDARPVVVLDRGVIVSAIAPAGEALGSSASVSGDGRFVAYQALPGGGDPAVAAADPRTSTVYLTDREALTVDVPPESGVVVTKHVEGQFGDDHEAASVAGQHGMDRAARTLALWHQGDLRGGRRLAIGEIHGGGTRIGGRHGRVATARQRLVRNESAIA